MLKRFWWVFLVMLPLGALGGLLVMAVVTYVIPKKYESEAVIEVKPQMDFGTSPSQVVPMFLATEFEKIKSRASLLKVVEKLKLTDKWGVEEDAAIQILKGIVTTQNIRGTDLISIRVRHTEREGARDIAAELARIYRDYRREILHRDRDRGLAELKKAVQEQEEKVEERRKILATIARTGSFIAGPDMTEEDVKKAMDELRAQDVIDAKRDFETDQALLQAMRLKQISATVAGEIQDDSVVVHEEPQIGNIPVSPNITLNLLFGAVGGFLLSPLLALAVMVLLSRASPAPRP